MGSGELLTAITAVTMRVCMGVGFGVLGWIKARCPS